MTNDNSPRPVAHPSAPCPADRPCYLPEPNPPPTQGLPVDSHTADVYERPAAPGSEATRVLAALDIVSSQAGSDDERFYFRIDVSGQNPDTRGLSHVYGFELDFDDDPAGELLVVVSDPSANVGSGFGTAGVTAYWNRNSNIFGATGELPDGPSAGDGYEVVAFERGANVLTGRRAVPDPLLARVAPQGSVVELAVRRAFLDSLKLNDDGVDVSGDVNEIGLRASASAAPVDPSAFTFHDRFGRRQSGSPYPFLRVAPSDRVTCPESDASLSRTEREALDSGTDQDTGIPNPCYPSAAVASFDNAYFVQTTYTPEVLAGQPPREEEPADPSSDGSGPAGIVVLLAGVVVALGAAAGWAWRRRRPGGASDAVETRQIG